MARTLVTGSQTLSTSGVAARANAREAGVPASAVEEELRLRPKTSGTRHLVRSTSATATSETIRLRRSGRQRTTSACRRSARRPPSFRTLKRLGRLADGAQQLHCTGPGQHHGGSLPQDDRVVKERVHPGWMDGPPHRLIRRKRRIHEEHVAHELIVGVVIGQVVEYHQRVEECGCRDKERFREARNPIESWSVPVCITFRKGLAPDSEGVSPR